MDYLLMPPKVPKYRQGRSHNDFLCTLKDHFSKKSDFKERVVSTLKEHFLVKEVFLEDLLPITKKNHRKATERKAESYLHFSLL